MAEISLFPVDKGIHLSEYVARALRVIAESGLTYELGPMGTTIEGDPAAVMDCARRCLESLADVSDRVYMLVKVDWRAGDAPRMKAKVEAVEALVR